MWLFLTIGALNKNQKKISKTVMVIIFWDFLMSDQIFLSSQVKQSLVISNKYGIYEFPHKLPNDWRLKKS